MKKLNYELREITKRNRDGSHATQANRHDYLQLIARQLHHLGYKGMGTTSLKLKHIFALVEHWQTEVSKRTGKPISNGTIKNRMTAIRWWADKIHKPNVVPKTNKELGIGDRIRMPVKDRAFSLTEEQKQDLPTYLNLSVRLQEEFGLRREGAAKFTYGQAVYKNCIKLKPSWTKGGRARTMPITKESQKKLLNEIKKYAPHSSLIPAHMNFDQYLSHRKYVLSGTNIPPTHGLRYHYAQQRYIVLTKGMVPPRLGGPKHASLTKQEKEKDLNARLIVSAELGHSRIEITRTYLG